MCMFTESILGEVGKCYEIIVDDETKKIIFRIFHHSLLVHYPKGHAADAPCSNSTVSPIANYADDLKVWTNQMHAMLNVVNKEINRQLKSFQPLSDEFVGFAVTVFATVSKKFEKT